MTTKIQVQRICKHCGNEFTAQTTKTQYCSHKCNSKDYKAKIRACKVAASNKETIQIRTSPIEELNAKEFLKVREVAKLLDCSVRMVYHYIEKGKLNAINLSERTTRIKRTDIDSLFK